MASARILVGVTLGVALAFASGTAISQHVEHRSAKDTDEIVANAMPSVQTLSRVRGSLRAIERAVSRRRLLTPEQLTRHIAEHRRDIDTSLAIYTALPFFPDEHSIYLPIPGLLHQLDRQLAPVTPEMSEQDAAAIETTLDQIDSVIERIESFDASQGQRLGLSIARARSESRSIVWLMDAATALLAIGAVWLAVRMQRRAVNVLEFESAHTEQRLAELSTQVDELAHFAGRVAHDIRSPLQAALLSIDYVHETSQNAQARLVSDRAIKALRRIQVLVEGLLQFARAGGKPPPDAACDMSAVIREVVDGLGPEARAEDIELTADVPPSAEAACMPGVLTSIVSNLTRNAIRHMGSAVERSVWVRVVDADASWRLEVQDTGPGIPPGQELRIFEPHVQLDPAGGGIGLGLATVDRLVRAHGGTLGVISPPGRGALFWVELPKRSVQ